MRSAGVKRLMKQSAEPLRTFWLWDLAQPSVDERLALGVHEDVGPPERVFDELEALGGKLRRHPADLAQVLEHLVVRPTVRVPKHRGIAADGRQFMASVSERKGPIRGVPRCGAVVSDFETRPFE